MSYSPLDNTLTVSKDNWDKRTGPSIGDSERIYGLRIFIKPWETDDTWLGELLQHLPRNRSIIQLTIEFLQLAPNQRRHQLKWDIFHTIIPFIENNSNLTDIQLCGGTTSMLRSLSSALSSCKNKRLERINLTRNQDEAGYREFFTSLNDYNNLREICVGDNKMWTEGVTILSSLLKKPSSSICSLELNNSLDDEHITILGNGLVGNKHVTNIDLWRNSSVTAVGWDRFSQALFHPECAIKTLRLVDTNLDDEGVTYVGYALAVNKSIKSLVLTDNDTITQGGLRGLLQCMRNPDSSLEQLILKNCGINDEGIALTMEKVAQSVSLKTLNMSSNNSITSRGLRTIYHALFNCELSLEVIYLEQNWGINFGDLEEEDWLLYPRALCDKSSINNTFYSNHTIQSIELDICNEEYETDEFRDYRIDLDRLSIIWCDIRKFLGMNYNENKVKVARKKIMKSHFAGEAVDISVFALMPEALIPHAIEGIGRDKLGFSLMYQFVAGYPLDFSDSISSRAAKKLKQSS